MKNIIIRDLTIIAVFTAMSVVLRFATIEFFLGRLTFYNIPIMIISFLYGPIPGVIAAGIADISSMMYQPGWSFEWMIPALLWGLIPGLLKCVLNYKNISSLIFIEMISHICVTLANTIIFGIVRNGGVFDNAFWALRLSSVLPVMMFKIPIDIIVLYAIIRRVTIPFFDKKEYN